MVIWRGSGKLTRISHIPKLPTKWGGKKIQWKFGEISLKVRITRRMTRGVIKAWTTADLHKGVGGNLCKDQCLSMESERLTDKRSKRWQQVRLQRMMDNGTLNQRIAELRQGNKQWFTRYVSRREAKRGRQGFLWSKKYGYKVDHGYIIPIWFFSKYTYGVIKKRCDWR